MIQIAVSTGELLDKVSILNIKLLKITDPIKYNKVADETNILEPLAHQFMQNWEIEKLYDKLYEVNLSLWTVEDELREIEKEGTFDSKFIALARSVYYLNDERSELKGEINRLTDSEIVEVKSYTNYQ